MGPDHVSNLFCERVGIVDFAARDDETFKLIMAVIMFVVVVMIIIMIIIVMVVVMNLMAGFQIAFCTDALAK